MTIGSFRPTFALFTTGSSADALARLSLAAKERRDVFDVQSREYNMLISIVEAKRHFWSPWLDLQFQESEKGTEIVGRLSPHPAIWTGFMFAYLALFVLTAFTCIVGIAQRLANQSAYVIYLVPLWILIAVALWAASQFGQKLAITEMEAMKQFVYDSLLKPPHSQDNASSK